MDAERTLLLHTNPFAAVFNYHPRTTMTPKENFLTEALIYALRNSNRAAEMWLECVSGRKLRIKEASFSSQARTRDKEGNGWHIPDLEALIQPVRGKPIRILAEHKWDSRVSVEQLKRYANLRKRGEELYVCLVYAKSADDQKATQFKPRKSIRYKAIRWEELYSALLPLVKEQSVKNFLSFLEFSGLAPGQPFRKTELMAFQRTGFKREKAGKAIRNRMMAYCQSLSTEYQWQEIPSAIRKEGFVHDGWGRCAFGFTWGAELTCGFLYETDNHQVQFVEPRLGVDLTLRILAPPRRGYDWAPVLTTLNRRVSMLQKRNATVHLRGDPGSRNSHTVLLARRPAWNVIGDQDTTEEQIAAIHKQLVAWCRVLFTDEVVSALRKLPSYG